MLWYSFLDKWGGFIKKFINWSLSNNNIVVIDNKNIECDYEKDKYIKYYEDEDTVNIVDLENKLYIRKTKEFIFKIDFINNIFSYDLTEKEISLRDKLLYSNINIKDTISMTYSLDKEEKKIIIQIL